jgi:hypothetical protein
MYNEDVQEEAVTLMNSHGLRMARMSPITDADTIFNAVVGTVEDGDFWYGDLNLNEDTNKLRMVSSAMGKTLRIATYDTPMPMEMLIPAH